MIKIFSKIEAGKLLHIVVGPSLVNERIQLVDESEFLQVASLNLIKGSAFRPHRHLFKKISNEHTIAQESWIVLSGLVEVTFYDLDDKILEKHHLKPGFLSITLYGGHEYKIIEDSMVFEFKTGPYLGQELDKIFIH
jgi:hypothetical protein